MADIDFPCGLPGVLVNSNGYSSSNRVRRNDLQSGPPIFVLESDDGYELFDVAWSFSGLDNQVFRNWFRYVAGSGSKLFNIELWVEGFDGTKQTKTHECYFDGPPSYVQNGRRWMVSATLLAIEEQIMDECDAISLINVYNGFGGYPSQGVAAIDASILHLEEAWPA